MEFPESEKNKDHQGKEGPAEGKPDAAVDMKNALTEMTISVDRAVSRCDTAEERNSNVETHRYIKHVKY